MTDEELNQYSLDFRKENFVNPMTVFRATGSEICRNLPESSNRHPWHHRGDWMDYWQMMSGNRQNVVHCSSCGKAILVDVNANDFLSNQIKRTVDDPEELQAVGGHIEVRGTTVFHQGIYITPQCKECNAIHDRNIPIRPGSVMEPEINPEIDNAQ